MIDPSSAKKCCARRLRTRSRGRLIDVIIGLGGHIDRRRGGAVLRGAAKIPRMWLPVTGTEETAGPLAPGAVLRRLARLSLVDAHAAELAATCRVGERLDMRPRSTFPRLWSPSVAMRRIRRNPGHADEQKIIAARTANSLLPLAQLDTNGDHSRQWAGVGRSSCGRRSRARSRRCRSKSASRTARAHAYLRCRRGECAARGRQFAPRRCLLTQVEVVRRPAFGNQASRSAVLHGGAGKSDRRELGWLMKEDSRGCGTWCPRPSRATSSTFLSSKCWHGWHRVIAAAVADSVVRGPKGTEPGAGRHRQDLTSATGQCVGIRH